MVRPNKDKSEEFSYGNVKGTEHRLVQVSIPFWHKATIHDKFCLGTTTQIVSDFKYTKDEIIQQFAEKEYRLIKFEKFTVGLPNFCERCHRKGTPTILKKSTYDNRYRSEIEFPTRDNRPDEYRLVYQHTEKPKICIIGIFDIEHFSFKNPKGRITELHKHFFPRYLEKMKKELVA